jgi:hypothetical protein
VDIVSGTGDVLLGTGWPGPQTECKMVFRRLTGDAFAYVPAVDPVAHRVMVMAGAEPGLEGQVVLTVFDAADRPLGEALLRGPETMILKLPAGPPALHALRCNARAAPDFDGLGRPVPWVRVFGIRAEPLRPDVVPQDAGFTVGGGGWYTLEERGDEAFRWVNNDAEIVVADPHAPRLELDLAPGPARGGRPLELTVLERGEPLARFVAGRRRKITLELPPREAPFTVTLHVDGPGETLPGSERVLNFRLFHIPPA